MKPRRNYVKPRRSYAKLRDLGKGAHAEVDEVRDKTDHQVYARKTYKLADGDKYETLRSRLRDELWIMEKLSTSSNSSRHLMVELIRAHEDEHNREFSLILRPVAEMSLRDLLTAAANKPLTINASKLQLLDQFLSDLANGLKFIHGESIRHKDIKPENILVYKERLLYADFGISLDFEPTRCCVTNSDKPSYTAEYAAPELLGISRGARSCKSDVFSLGCVFYELLATYGGASALRDKSIYGSCFYLYGYMAQSDFLKDAIQSCFEGGVDRTMDDYLRVAKSMLSVEKEDRPTAREVVTKLPNASYTPPPHASYFDAFLHSVSESSPLVPIQTLVSATLKLLAQGKPITRFTNVTCDPPGKEKVYVYMAGLSRV